MPERIENQFVGDWNIELDRQEQTFNIFHKHDDEDPEFVQLHFAEPQEKDPNAFKCRECGELAPLGVVAYGRVRDLMKK